jgi:hypothetical protein
LQHPAYALRVKIRIAERTLDRWLIECRLLPLTQDHFALVANVSYPPFVAELIAKLEVFGSFPGLSLTGEMRTPVAALPTWF